MAPMLETCGSGRAGRLVPARARRCRFRPRIRPFLRRPALRRQSRGLLDRHGPRSRRPHRQARRALAAVGDPDRRLCALRRRPRRGERARRRRAVDDVAGRAARRRSPANRCWRGRRSSPPALRQSRDGGRRPFRPRLRLRRALPAAARRRRRRRQPGRTGRFRARRRDREHQRPADRLVRRHHRLRHPAARRVAELRRRPRRPRNQPRPRRRR